MAYSTTNPPRLMIPAMGGPLAANSTSVVGGGNLWLYRTTVDLTSNLCTPGYFTNGKQLGMRPGDFLFGACITGESSQYTVLSAIVSTNSTNGFNLSTESMITSTFS